MHLNLKKYKKIAQDKDKSTFQHPDGHSMTVMHRALTPSMRKEVTAIPLAEGGYVDLVDSGDPIYQAAKKEPAPSPAKEGNGWTSKPTHSAKDPKEDVSDQAKAFNAKLAPTSGVQRFAEGTPDTPVQDVDYQELPEQIPQEVTPPQAPVTINIGQPQQAPSPQSAPPETQVPTGQGVGHYVGNLLRQGVSDAAGAFKTIGAPIASGVEGLVQGASGQPLAAVPMMDQGTPSPRAAEPSLAPPAVSNETLAPAPPQAKSPNPYQSAMQEQIKGLELGEKAQETAAKGKEAALEDYNKAQTEANNTYDAHIQDAMALRQDAMNALQEGKIDPQRYWNNKSIGGKVSSIIGILAAGFNPTHNPNAAIEMLNREIDRDIEGQKADLGRKQTLLSAANDHFRNIQSASDFHRVMANDLVSHQIDQALAKAATPMAQAELMKARGALKFDSEMRMAQVGAMQTLNGQAVPEEQAKALNTLRLVAPEKAKEYESRIIPGVGTSTVPVPEKKREAFAAADTFIKQMDALEHFRQQHAGTVLDRGIVDEGHRLAELARNSFRIAQGEGVFKEGSAKFNERLIPDPTDLDFFKKNKAAYQAMKDQAGSEVKSSMAVYGIKPATNSIFTEDTNLSPQEKTFYDFAKANPKDPRSKQILNKLGIK